MTTAFIGFSADSLISDLKKGQILQKPSIFFWISPIPEKQRLSGLLAISSRDIRNLHEILKGFIKKISEKSWKFLIENRFWKYFSKIFRKFWKSWKSRKIENRKSWILIEIFDDFSRFFKIFQKFWNFSKNIFKIDFRSKIFNFFHWFF